MTRIKEKDPDSGELPDYKSPANRIVHSLRKGYDNIRGKLKKARDEIKYYQIKVRDLEKSRELHKNKVSQLEKNLKQLEKENIKLKAVDKCCEVKKNQK